jgi:ATP-dependent DNA ligase
MRIVFKDLDIKLGYESVLKSFSPTAKERYDQCTNLRTVLEEEGGEEEVVMGLKLFTHFKPMLAKGYNTASHGLVDTVEKAMDGNPFLMDVKLDGERMLVHIKDKKVMMLTRNGTDYTESYSTLANIIMKNVNVSTCILDGEVMSWDNFNGTFIPFGSNRGVGKNENMKYEAAKGKPGWDRNLTQWLVFKVFDIIYIGGLGSAGFVQTAIDNSEVQTRSNFEDNMGEIGHLALAVRRRILNKVFNPIENRFEVVQSLTVTAIDVSTRRLQLEGFFNTVTIAGEEGLVIKDLTSKYALGDLCMKICMYVYIYICIYTFRYKYVCM